MPHPWGTDEPTPLPGLYEHSKIMFPMAAIFALHILPASGGSRTAHHEILEGFQERDMLAATVDCSNPAWPHKCICILYIHIHIYIYIYI